MKYSVENLINSSADNKFLFFWGHTSLRDGSVTKSCFSQWWEEPFTVSGITYNTAEHWMMAKKAELFGDDEMANRIIQCSSPAEAKKLGREVKGYVDELWLSNRFQIVCEGNHHKFSQNNNLKDFLLKTGSRILVEASPVDSIWGIGMDANHPDAGNPEEWQGLNLLGFALMEVRDKLSKNQ